MWGDDRRRVGVAVVDADVDGRVLVDALVALIQFGRDPLGSQPAVAVRRSRFSALIVIPAAVTGLCLRLAGAFGDPPCHRAGERAKARAGSRQTFAQGMELSAKSR